MVERVIAYIKDSYPASEAIKISRPVIADTKVESRAIDIDTGEVCLKFYDCIWRSKFKATLSGVGYEGIIDTGICRLIEKRQDRPCGVYCEQRAGIGRRIDCTSSFERGCRIQEGITVVVRQI